MKENFTRIMCECKNWIHLAQGRSSEKIHWTQSRILGFHRRQKISSLDLEVGLKICEIFNG